MNSTQRLAPLLSAFLAGSLALFLTGQLSAESSAPLTLIKAGRMLDPRSGNVLSPAAVLIENGKIKEVGSPSQVQGHAPAGVKTICHYDQRRGNVGLAGSHRRG